MRWGHLEVRVRHSDETGQAGTGKKNQLKLFNFTLTSVLHNIATFTRKSQAHKPGSKKSVSHGLILRGTTMSLYLY